MGVCEPDAELLRAARRSAGLTQVELASRAGVTQSVISAYEAGRRQPSLPMLMGLVEAAGVALHVELRPLPEGLVRLTGPVGVRVRRRRGELVEAAGRHGVTGLQVFGSVARGEDRPDSDVDLLVELPAGMGVVGLGLLRAELERILTADVDLVPAQSLKPGVRRRVERELVAL